MNSSTAFILEDGQGHMYDEKGFEVMEVEEQVIDLKTLTSMDEYLKHRAQQELMDIDPDQADTVEVNAAVKTETSSRSKAEVSGKKKKTWTNYSFVDKYNFINHMLTKLPPKIAPIARKYNINPRTGQRWWKQYCDDPEGFLKSKPRGNRKLLDAAHEILYWCQEVVGRVFICELRLGL